MDANEFIDWRQLYQAALGELKDASLDLPKGERREAVEKKIKSAEDMLARADAKLAKDQNSEAIRLLKAVEGIEDRNDIMHSVIGGNANQIWFNRRKTKNRFTSKIERYNHVRLNSTVLNIADLSGKLMKALGISRTDYLDFFQQSHNAANNSPVSP